MAPPRDTAGSSGTHHHSQPAAAPGRYNQKSTFRNGTTEEAWFYPTPAALKAAADVRGTRAHARRVLRQLRRLAAPFRSAPRDAPSCTTPRISLTACTQRDMMLRLSKSSIGNVLWRATFSRRTRSGMC